MIKLCIAEDEYYVQKSLKARIKMLPFDIEIKGYASNGAEALDLYYKYNPNIFLVDINMPNSDGFYFIRKAKENPNNRTIFIIISGYSDFDYMKKAIKYSVFDYIKKPIIQEELQDILSRAIDQIEKEKSEKLMYSKEYIYCDEFLESIAGDKLNGTFLCVYDCLNNNFINSSAWAELYETLNEIGDFETIILRYDRSVCLFYMKNQNIPLEKLKKVCRIFNKNNNGIFISQYLNQIEFEIALNSIENSLCNRFFQKFSYFSIEDSTSNKYELENMELLIYAIDQGNSDLLQKQISDRMNVLQLEQSNVQMSAYYHQVILLIINKYIEKNLNAPENVRREMLPFSLVKFKEFNQVVESLCYIGEELIESINKNKQTMDLMTEICLYLQNHYGDNITLNELAKYFFISPSYLSHYFKTKKNISIVQYLQDIRLNKAQEYLKKTQMTISDVAEQVGYLDSNYFTKVFRKEFNISPSEYRKIL